MPIYEYQCETCGQRTEAIQRFGDAPLTECPHCAGPLKKMFSAPAFQLKGSGWYKTDYAAPAAKAPSGGSGGSGGSSGSGGSDAPGESSDSAKLIETAKKPTTGMAGDAAPTGAASSSGAATKPAASSTSSE